MIFLLDIHFEDSNFDVLVHLVTTLDVSTAEEADLFKNELVAALIRNKVDITFCTCIQIDNNRELYETQMLGYAKALERATTTILIEQFLLKEPDQSKTLGQNILNKIFDGEDSVASIGRRYNIPVRVKEKTTGNSFKEVYYFGLEHLIPKQTN